MSKAEKSAIDYARGVTGETGTLKARVERTALELFSRNGVDGVSIKQIASAAGVSEGAMYRHYTGKEALAAALFDTIHARLYALIEAELEKTTDLKSSVEGVVKVYCAAADEDVDLFAYHLTHMYKYGPQSREGRPDPVSLVVKRIRKAITDGDIPKNDPEVLAAAALGVVLQSAAHMLSGRLDPPLSQHSQILSEAAYRVLKAL